MFGGKELNNFTGLTDFGRRNLDAPLGRFTSQDRFSEKYFGLCTMGYAAGNPIRLIDINGDSLDISNILIHDEINKTNLATALINQLKELTGLDLTVDKNTGLVQYSSTNRVASETAKKDLMKIIDGPKVDIFISAARSITPHGGKQIGISPNQIQKFIDGTPAELDPRTMGLGMTLLHEYSHTKAGGSLSDISDLSDTYSKGDVVKKDNIYRSELDANNIGINGKKFGQRAHYLGIPNTDGSVSLRFIYDSVNRNGKMVNRTTEIKFK